MLWFFGQPMVQSKSKNSFSFRTTKVSESSVMPPSVDKIWSLLTSLECCKIKTKHFYLVFDIILIIALQSTLWLPNGIEDILKDC